MVEEIYKPIVGYESSYEVSNYGNVRSLDRVTDGIDKWDRDFRIRGKQIKPWVAGTKYPTVELSINSKGKSYLVHRLLAIAHIPNPDNLPYVNHIDGNKLNNHISNLEWCTAGENIEHAFRTGLRRHLVGEDKKTNKVTAVDVINIWHVKGAMASHKIGQLYGITGSTVRHIQNNQTWTHVKRGQL